MGYYVRLLSKSIDIVPVKDLRAALKKAGSKARIEIEEGSARKWTSLLLVDRDDNELVSIERNQIEGSDEMPREELAEFIDEVADLQPKRGARWLQQYLPGVKTIYAFQILDGDWQAVFAPVRNELWARLGGIFQADYEGFSNEDGYHIVWQFSDHVSGPWSVAVLDKDGSWLRFEMDLGNKKHRAAFKAGRVPAGVEAAR